MISFSNDSEHAELKEKLNEKKTPDFPIAF